VPLDRTPLVSSKLRLFSAELIEEDREIRESSELSPDITLSEFYDKYFLPVILLAGKADAKTVADYRSSVRRWAELTGDPTLGEITNVACARFIEMEFLIPGRKSGSDISPNTIRKHCGNLQRILHVAGPQCERYPAAPTAFGLFGTDCYGRPRLTPFFNRPPKRDKLPEDLYTVEEIRRLIEASQKADSPVSNQFTPAEWWTALFRFLYNTGLRIGSALACQREWIFRGEGRGKSGEWRVESGEYFYYLSVPGVSYKQGRPHLFYLSHHAIEAVQKMPRTGKIFPWAKTPTTLTRHMKKLMKAAEIPQEKYFGLAFHGMRKSLGTALWGVDQEAARLQLGHASKSTTEQSYAGQSQLANSLAAAVGRHLENLEQP
jgi:integrase